MQCVDESTFTDLIEACSNPLVEDLLFAGALGSQANLCGLHTVYAPVETETQQQQREQQHQHQVQSSSRIPEASVRLQHCSPQAQQQSPELPEPQPMWPPCTSRKRSSSERRAHSQPLQPHFLEQLPSSVNQKRSRSVLDTSQRSAKRQATLGRETWEQPPLPLLPSNRLPNGAHRSRSDEPMPILSPMTSTVQSKPSHLSPSIGATQLPSALTRPPHALSSTLVNRAPVSWTPEMVTELDQAVKQLPGDNLASMQLAKAVWQRIGCPAIRSISSVRHSSHPAIVVQQRHGCCVCCLTFLQPPSSLCCH